MDTYTAEYASLYDRIGLSLSTERLAQRLLHWYTSQNGDHPPCVLDLACGTGAAALVFAAAGCSVVGIDLSAAMLEQAQYKAEQAGLPITYIQADMRTLADVLPDGVRQPASFDLVMCLGGSLNELVAEDDLQRVFAGAALLLKPGGSFVFDRATQAEYQTWNSRDEILYNNQDYVIYQHLTRDQQGPLAQRHIGWFVRAIDTWWRSEETHHERCWTDEEQAAALQSVPLRITASMAPEDMAPEDMAPEDMAPEEDAAGSWWRRVVWYTQKEP
jgi:ubiquinone/menaquinone biosynthesis C-methylase UbiE